MDAGNRWILHAGDASYHHGTLDGHGAIPRILCVGEDLLSLDRKQLRAKQARLAELYRRADPDLLIVNSHDPEFFSRRVSSVESMTTNLEGKVALITGAARGQGRSHAMRLADEGADIIAIDIARQITSVPYPMGTPEDLDITRKEVDARGRRVFTAEADIRDFDALKAAVDAGVAKHGVVGLMRSWANWLAPHSIRVNTVHPTGVNTPMVVNEAMGEFFASNPAAAEALTNLLPVPMLEAGDISDAVAWLVSDQARYITGVTLPVDAGFTAK